MDSIASAPHGPVEATGGRLVYVGNGKLEGREAVLCVESTDETRSWRVVGPVLFQDDFPTSQPAFTEPHVAELAGGDLVCVIRTDNEVDGIHSSRSTDGGRTWSPPERAGMVGFDQLGHLITLADGRLLCTYGKQSEPFGQRACLSEDSGRSWRLQDEIVLRSDSVNTDLGYPASVEITPGELLSVYYQVDQPGDKVCIQGTRWTLNG